jgi:hypothetical protein
MRVNVCLQAVLCALAILCLPDGRNWLCIGPGLAQAQTKEVYTRKRVNGVWTTGKFKRANSVRTRSKRDHARRISTAVASQATDYSVLLPPRRPSDPQSVVVLAEPVTVPLQPVAVSPQAVPVQPRTEDYMQRLQRALEARARMIASERATLSPSRVRLVTYNFETSIKTIVYVDGSTRKEHFDPAATTGTVDFKP